MGSLLNAWNNAPTTTRGCAVLAVAITAVALCWSIWRLWRWRRERRLLDSISTDLSTHAPFSTLQPAELFQRAEEAIKWMRQEGCLKREAAGQGMVGELVREVEDLLPVRRSGGDGGWESILARFHEMLHLPVTLLRQAAGWVVLIGLMGTVLGFIEALPHLRNAFAGAGDAMTAKSTGEFLGVLSGLGGVFLATLAGVGCAIVLYALALLLSSLSEQLVSAADRLGQRWFVPMLRAPDSVFGEETAREIERRFSDLRDQFGQILNPVVGQLKEALAEVPKQVEDFSANIEKGRLILDGFHGAVKTLGTSADAAVQGLTTVARESVEIVKKLPDLQAKGREEFLEAARELATPIESLSSIGKNLAASVETLSTKVEKLDVTSEVLRTSVETHESDVDTFRQELRASAAQSSQQVEAIHAIADSVAQAVGQSQNLHQRIDAAVARMPDPQAQLEAVGRLAAAAEAQRDLAEQSREIVVGLQGTLGSMAAAVQRLEQAQDSMESVKVEIPEIGTLRDTVASFREVAEDWRGSSPPQRGVIPAAGARNVAPGPPILQPPPEPQPRSEPPERRSSPSSWFDRLFGGGGSR